MKKVLVLGATGLIGHQAFKYLQASAKYSMYNFSFRKKLNDESVLLDARDELNFLGAIREIRPDYIVNCIGILIDGAERFPENAIFLNAYLPHRISQLADSIDAKLIHMSTDCVFSGNKKTPYLENDVKDGSGVYAKTKGLGEIISERHLTLRTSVVGPELKKNGEELFNWFMGESGTVNGYSASKWSGVTTLELARAIDSSIQNEITGLHHVTNNSSISKYDILMLFKKYTKKNINIIQIEGINSDKSFLDTRGLIGLNIPSYEVMFSEMVSAIQENNNVYTHYSFN